MMVEFTSYDLEDLIGRGAFGAVYTGSHKLDGCRVAIRILHTELTGSKQVKDNFSKEMGRVSRLHHPNLCRILEFGEVQDHLAIVMEYLDSPTLLELLGSPPQPLPHVRAIQIVREILKGMNYVHSKGLIHGDLAPGNVFIRGQVEVKIADLGVAGALGFGHETGPGLAVRSLCYMSPEHLMEGVVDRQMDIYSIGMILYKALAGEMPRALDDITEREVMTAVLRRPLPPVREVNPDVPKWLQDVVTAAVSRDPLKRIKTCEDFLDRL